MAFGALLTQAWRLVWGHKFLIVIGAAPVAIIMIASVLNSLTGILGTLFMYAGAILAEACLIAGIHQVITAGGSTYRQAWDVAWPKKWPLAGIFALASVPGTVVASVMGTGLSVIWLAALLFADIQSDPTPLLTGLAAGAGLTVLMCGLLVIIAIPVSIWSRGAIIACLTEDTGVIDSYRRAWAIIQPNLAQVVTLALIQIAISLGLNMILLLPELVILFCPLGWLAAWFVRGFLIAWWTAVWVIAWREWAATATNRLSVRT